MGNLGGGEMLVILLVALIVLGPTKLPPAIRQVGKFVGEIRRIGQGFQSELREAAKPLQEASDTLKTADDNLRAATKQPLSDAKASFSKKHAADSATKTDRADKADKAGRAERADKTDSAEQGDAADSADKADE